jgi:hypothetical protein
MPTWRERGAPGCPKCRYVGCQRCYCRNNGAGLIGGNANSPHPQQRRRIAEPAGMRPSASGVALTGAKAASIHGWGQQKRKRSTASTAANNSNEMVSPTGTKESVAAARRKHKEREASALSLSSSSSSLAWQIEFSDIIAVSADAVVSATPKHQRVPSSVSFDASSSVSSAPSSAATIAPETTYYMNDDSNDHDECTFDDVLSLLPYYDMLLKDTLFLHPTELVVRELQEYVSQTSPTILQTATTTALTLLEERNHDRDDTLNLVRAPIKAAQLRVGRRTRQSTRVATNQRMRSEHDNDNNEWQASRTIDKLLREAQADYLGREQNRDGATADSTLDPDNTLETTKRRMKSTVLLRLLETKLCSLCSKKLGVYFHCPEYTGCDGDDDDDMDSDGRPPPRFRTQSCCDCFALAKKTRWKPEQAEAAFRIPGLGQELYLKCMEGRHGFDSLMFGTELYSDEVVTGVALELVQWSVWRLHSGLARCEETRLCWQNMVQQHECRG